MVETHKPIVKHHDYCPICGSRTGIKETENVLGDPVLSLNCPDCGSKSTSRDGGVHWFTWLLNNGEDDAN